LFINIGYVISSDLNRLSYWWIESCCSSVNSFSEWSWHCGVL